MTTRAFDEWPLAVFTTLAILGGGLLTAPLVAPLAAPSADTRRRVLLAGAALLGAGLLVSSAHLGRPFRAPLAGARVGRSRLSNEVALAVAAVVAGGAAAFFPSFSGHTTFVPAALAVAFLLSLGMVYSLPGQITWQGGAAFTPLVLGLGFAALVLAAGRGGAVWGGEAVAGAAVVLAVDVSLFVGPWRRATVHRDGRLLLATRFLLVDLLPACLMLAGLPEGAAGALGVGILIDRLSFYLLAVQHTTEAEIARVEEIIALPSGPASKRR